MFQQICVWFLILWMEHILILILDGVGLVYFKMENLWDFCKYLIYISYMSTMISIGVFISSILINKLFEPIVPATAALFEPVITAILCDIATV